MEIALEPTHPAPSRWRPLVQRLVRLAQHPCSLLFALLLINALARPYADLIHDARLYSVQVLNRVEPGLYADDLYLRYGSQDSFSVFSSLISPVVKLIGLRPAFLTFYLLSNALLLYGAQRFVMTLVRRRLTAVLALFYVAVNPVTFGGLGVFHMNETFLTPRIAAVGLVLLGLERLIKNQWTSLAFIGLAVVVHPIMAFSGLLVWLYFALASRLSARQMLRLTAIVGLVVGGMLAYYPLGSAVFGPMDATWRSYVHAANFYATPSEWLAMDWLRIATAFAITFFARHGLGFSEPVRRLLDAIMVVALVGALGAVIVPYLPYALPFQGQPYRALWLLQFVQIPLLVALLRKVLLGGSTQVRQWGLIAGTAFVAGIATPIQIFSPIGLLICSGARRLVSQRYTGWTRASLMAAAGLACFLCVLPIVMPFIVFSDKMLGLPTPVDVLRFVPLALGPIYNWLISLVAIALLYRWTRGERRFQATALAGCLAVQVMFVTTARLPLWNGGLSEHNASVNFVQKFLDEKFDKSRGLPTVYWPHARLDDLWVTLPAKSYFTKQQTAGSMFNRGTAVEGQRRASLVRAFELEELKRDTRGAKWGLESLARVFGDIDYTEPTLADLYRVCCEDVDYIVIKHDFPGFHSANVGCFFVYECDAIRDRIREELPQTEDSAPLDLARQF